MTAAVIPFPARANLGAVRRTFGIAPVKVLPTARALHPAMGRAIAAYQEHRDAPAGVNLGILSRMRNAVAAITAAGAPVPEITHGENAMTATFTGHDSKLSLIITNRSYKVIHVNADGDEWLQERGVGSPNLLKLAATVKAYYSQQPTP